jgi:hypothetical protein
MQRALRELWGLGCGDWLGRGFAGGFRWYAPLVPWTGLPGLHSQGAYFTAWRKEQPQARRSFGHVFIHHAPSCLGAIGAAAPALSLHVVASQRNPGLRTPCIVASEGKRAAGNSATGFCHRDAYRRRDRAISREVPVPWASVRQCHPTPNSRRTTVVALV